jgi:hypothetical protein
MPAIAGDRAHLTVDLATVTAERPEKGKSIEIPTFSCNTLASYELCAQWPDFISIFLIAEKLVPIAIFTSQRVKKENRK